jgi:hypothetical protein
LNLVNSKNQFRDELLIDALKWVKCILFLVLFGVALEFVYFVWVFLNPVSVFPETGLVAVYSGNENRVEWIRKLSKKKPDDLFLFSGCDYNSIALKGSADLQFSSIILENRARTTDQNARYSAPLIKKIGVKQMVLALPWYHLPRALFLTRFYLRGSGIIVSPYATVPLPSGWFFNHWFWVEMVKFWGSLGRVFLSACGIEESWFHG